MKIVCCSDFQIGAGRTLGISLEEQERWLSQIVDLADDADLLLHCGDAFESRHTNRDQDEVFMRFLVETARRCPVLVVQGNHDWRGYERASTVGIFREMGVTVALDPGVHRYGDVAVACLPWTAVGRLVAAHDGGDRAETNQLAARHLTTVAAGLREQCKGQAAILAAHWAVSGASLPTGLATDLLQEPVIEIADLAAQRWEAIALGHIHRAQAIDCGVPAFYCGSPFPCDWGEADDEHGVWILEPDPVTGNDRERAIYVPQFVPLDGPKLVKIGIHLDEPPASAVPDAWLDADLEGAIVRVRISGPREHVAAVDVAGVKRALVDEGARRVFCEVDVERAERARVEGMSDDLDELQALALWLESQSINGTRAEALTERTRAYMEAVR